MDSGRIICIGPYEPKTTKVDFKGLWKGIQISESGKILPAASGILGFGIQNAAQGIWKSTNDKYPESNFHWRRLESSTWNPESTGWSLESKTFEGTEIVERDK